MPSRVTRSRPRKCPRSTRRSTASRSPRTRSVDVKGGGASRLLCYCCPGAAVVKKLFLLIALVFAASASPATPRANAPAPYAGQRALPATQPMWAEFGQTYLEPVFGQAVVVVGASTGDWPSHMRSLGAGTVYFDLNLRNRVGTPTKPTDPSTMADRAKRLYDFASAQSGCSTPVVVFNELAGPGLVTPWSDTN